MADDRQQQGRDRGSCPNVRQTDHLHPPPEMFANLPRRRHRFALWGSVWGSSRPTLLAMHVELEQLRSLNRLYLLRFVCSIAAKRE